MLHRHDIEDKIWNKINKNLPGSKGYKGRNGVDNRKFINAVLWILRTGVPWRDLPPEYGDWKNTHRRFSRWRSKGIWDKILEALKDESDMKCIMIDSTCVKCHVHSCGARGGNQEMAKSKGGSIQKSM